MEGDGRRGIEFRILPINEILDTPQSVTFGLLMRQDTWPWTAGAARHVEGNMGFYQQCMSLFYITRLGYIIMSTPCSEISRSSGW